MLCYFLHGNNLIFNTTTLTLRGAWCWCLRGWWDTQCLGWVMPFDQVIFTAGFFIIYQIWPYHSFRWATLKVISVPRRIIPWPPKDLKLFSRNRAVVRATLAM